MKSTLTMEYDSKPSQDKREVDKFEWKWNHFDWKLTNQVPHGDTIPVEPHDSMMADLGI